jgi:hypothetical protein
MFSILDLTMRCGDANITDATMGRVCAIPGGAFAEERKGHAACGSSGSSPQRPKRDTAKMGPALHSCHRHKRDHWNEMRMSGSSERAVAVVSGAGHQNSPQQAIAHSLYARLQAAKHADHPGSGYGGQSSMQYC